MVRPLVELSGAGDNTVSQTTVHAILQLVSDYQIISSCLSAHCKRMSVSVTVSGQIFLFVFCVALVSLCLPQIGTGKSTISKRQTSQMLYLSLLLIKDL